MLLVQEREYLDKGEEEGKEEEELYSVGDSTSSRIHQSPGIASLHGASCIDKNPNSWDASVRDREREISFLTGT